MQSNNYEIWKGAGDPFENYHELFKQIDIL